jgi:mannosyltransferase OCH1-like enzyme
MILIIVVLLAILLLILLYTRNTNYFESFDSKEDIIPHYFFQIWINEENTVPSLIKQSFDRIQQDNPEFECQLYNKNDCIKFLETHYNEDVQRAYHAIIPGSFKADLMRYCILYMKGGIYLDAKMKPINGFKLMDVTDKEYFTKDFESSGGGIANAFIVCKQSNPILLNAINTIVKHVDEEFYGNSPLEPTGPLLLKKQFTEEELNNLEYTLTRHSSTPVLIISKEPDNMELAILEKNEELVSEQRKNSTTMDYGHFWSNRTMYKYD